MKKHAYLIMAYNNFDFLKRLINLLDDERNDIYVHIDKKSLNFNESEFKNATKYSKLTFIGRKQVLWADYSEFDVELDLMQAAREGQKRGGITIIIFYLEWIYLSKHKMKFITFLIAKMRNL